MGHKTTKQYRLQNRWYDEESYYFLTICTKNRINYFGKIEAKDSDFVLIETPIAVKIAEFIKNIPKLYPNAQLIEWCVMPNHLHLIILLGIENSKNTFSIPILKLPKKFKAAPSQSISVIIGQLKKALTVWCQTENYEFGWQARFHDHVIRNEKSLHFIQEYIKNNPKTWGEDIFNKINEEEYLKRYGS
ncbi:MAG: transposase [Emticicia sp.]|uniref:transposase n=1 Tax=Emticicia sp. TaxID=1930953 RepID=UPI003BA752CC